MRNFRYFDPLTQFVRTSLTCSTILVFVSMLTAMTACKAGEYGTDEQGILIMPPQDAADTTTCPVCAQCTVCTEDPNLALEFFGDGRDGDLIIPPSGAPIVLIRDMFWRNIVAPPGTSVIDPNGFVIHASGLVSGPTLAADSGPPLLRISRDGGFGSTSLAGSGYLASGSIGGASGFGASGGFGAGAAATAPDAWPSAFHPGAGGNGGLGSAGAGGAGSSGSVLAASAGSLDVFSAMRMRLKAGDAPLGGGGAGGAGGGDGGTVRGGGGGGGGGNIVFIVKQIENASHVLVSSAGGNGGLPIDAGGGGGGGGGGGDVTVIVYRKPFPLMVVTGGIGGVGLAGPGSNGANGASGTAIPFSFVL